MTGGSLASDSIDDGSLIETDGNEGAHFLNRRATKRLTQREWHRQRLTWIGLHRQRLTSWLGWHQQRLTWLGFRWLTSSIWWHRRLLPWLEWHRRGCLLLDSDSIDDGSLLDWDGINDGSRRSGGISGHAIWFCAWIAMLDDWHPWGAVREPGGGINHCNSAGKRRKL